MNMYSLVNRSCFLTYSRSLKATVCLQLLFCLLLLLLKSNKLSVQLLPVAFDLQKSDVTQKRTVDTWLDISCYSSKVLVQMCKKLFHI